MNTAVGTSLVTYGKNMIEMRLGGSGRSDIAEKRRVRVEAGEVAKEQKAGGAGRRRCHFEGRRRRWRSSRGRSVAGPPPGTATLDAFFWK